MKKIAIYFLLLAIFISCSGKKEYFTADIKFKCTDIGFFDTLSTVLITSNSSDLGGEPNTFEGLFGSKRVYKKNVPKVGGHFYIDSVEKSQYQILLVECFIMGNVLYTSYERNMDFSDPKKDTVEIEVCMQPNMTIKQN